jgi:hypothetical protein
MRLATRHRALGTAAILLALAASLPSSLHYLNRRWTDPDRSPLVGLTRSEIYMASYLRTLNPERTVVLNDRPLDPSLLAVLSNAVSCSRRGDTPLAAVSGCAEVEAFYGSTREVPN